MVVVIGLSACESGSGTPGDDPGGTELGGQDAIDQDLPEDAETPIDAREDRGMDSTVGPDVADNGKPDGGKDNGGGDDTGTDPGHDDGPLPECHREGDHCSDGDPCTWGEKCDAELECTGGTPYSCDDGRACTDNVCDGKGNCRFTLWNDACLINGICRTQGDANPDVECEACLPSVDKAGWSRAANNTQCDPADSLPICQEAAAGYCVDGACVTDFPVEKGCDDGNPCSQDWCDDELGCRHQNVSGVRCTLADRCKEGMCNQGVCVIQPGASCDDGNPCTENICDPLNGCVTNVLSGIPCDDEDGCTLEDSCFVGVCSGIQRNCDDGNICTEDGCDAVLGCYYDVIDNPCCIGGVSRCDDGNPCTNDGCDPDTLACIWEFNSASCNDYNPCTVNDSCEEGDCVGTFKNCSDGNDCTLDYCQGGFCLHENLNGVACNDGLECSVNDTCVNGTCIADLSGCVCTPTFSPAVSKFVTMSIADNGQTGNGLNLDGKTTCAPADNCCCGIDNALGPLAGLPVANDGIKKAIEEGNLMLLFEHRGLRTDNQPYTLVFNIGKLDASNPTCNYQTQSCAYTVDRAVFDEECEPLVSLDNARINGNKLTAGGPGYTFPFELPLLEGVNLQVNLYLARIEATVTVSAGRVTSMSGIMGGAVPKQQIIDAINAIPDDEWPSDLPLDKGTILMFLDVLVVPDIDGDGDGTLESASIGIRFTAIAGTIVGTH
jgi:hypothetical protein